MISRDDITSEVEKELDDLLATAPDNLSAKVLEAVGEGTKMADHFSPIFRAAFPS